MEQILKITADHLNEEYPLEDFKGEDIQKHVEHVFSRINIKNLIKHCVEEMDVFKTKFAYDMIEECEEDETQLKIRVAALLAFMFVVSRMKEENDEVKSKLEPIDEKLDESSEQTP